MLLRNKELAVLDLDGVVYVGEQGTERVGEAIATLKGAGLRIAYLTNNSGKRPSQIASKMRKLGILVDDREIVTSGSAAADLLQARDLNDIYVCGSSDLKAMLVESGLRLVDKSADCRAILIGASTDFNYQSISEALPGLLKGVPMIACNRDNYFPVENGRFLPGCGAMVGALEGASGRRCDAIVGKPNPALLESICARYEIGADACFMVGDSLDSDIDMAQGAGVDAIWISPSDQKAERALAQAASLFEVSRWFT